MFKMVPHLNIVFCFDLLICQTAIVQLTWEVFLSSPSLTYLDVANNWFVITTTVSTRVAFWLLNCIPESSVDGNVISLISHVIPKTLPGVPSPWMLLEPGVSDDLSIFDAPVPFSPFSFLSPIPWGSTVFLPVWTHIYIEITHNNYHLQHFLALSRST